MEINGGGATLLPREGECSRRPHSAGPTSSSTPAMEVTVNTSTTTTTTTIIECSSSTTTTGAGLAAAAATENPGPGTSPNSSPGGGSPGGYIHHHMHHGSPLHHQLHPFQLHHTAPPSPLAAVRSHPHPQQQQQHPHPAGCPAVCCTAGAHHIGHVPHLGPHHSLYPLMAAASLGYAGSSGPSSLVNSPALGRRKRYTSTSSNCSSQFNNNYAGLDVDSLDDMLKKVSDQPVGGILF
ncbi:GL14426 [Drosophila persimilis]|uniref:GL14426 n=1 Tax=Drosophila persimilis TaxID=7234 RepID=B4GTU8_DROPE|nr:GL14426 [Drosophila persimilis]